MVLHSGCVIGADGFGFVMEGGRYEKFPQVGRVEIGDYVEIGANACVDRAALGVTSIGEGTKLDNMVHVGHNCRIGRHVVIAAQTGFSGGVVVEDYAVIGGQVGIGDKARIESRRGAGLRLRNPHVEDRARRAGGLGHARAPAERIPGATGEPGAAARHAQGTGRDEAPAGKAGENRVMLVVVGGHSRNIGKTSVAAGLIAALPQYNWTAMKITQHGHGICSAVGEPCDCAVEYDHPYAISEESAPGASDSARFLAAGARRSYWLRTAVGQLGNAVAEIRRIVSPAKTRSSNRTASCSFGSRISIW